MQTLDVSRLPQYNQTCIVAQRCFMLICLINHADCDADHTGLSVLAVINDIAARLALEEKGSPRGRL
jgi:hypothetical protein